MILVVTVAGWWLDPMYVCLSLLSLKVVVCKESFSLSTIQHHSTFSSPASCNLRFSGFAGGLLNITGLTDWIDGHLPVFVMVLNKGTYGYSKPSLWPNDTSNSWQLWWFAPDLTGATLLWGMSASCGCERTKYFHFKKGGETEVTQGLLYC